MRVRVKILAGKEGEEEKGRMIEIADDDTYETVLEKLNLNLEEVIVLHNGKPVPEDERVADKSDASGEIKIIRIVSAG
ncbi:MAG: ubiquitin family protein [Candidatus Methanospirareceae archaeon]